MNYLSNQYPVEVIRGILNQSIEESWFSNHVLALALLVGKLINNDPDRPFGCFYGSELKEGIPEELGIKILDKMMSFQTLSFHEESHRKDNNYEFFQKLFHNTTRQIQTLRN